MKSMPMYVYTGVPKQLYVMSVGLTACCAAVIEFPKWPTDTKQTDRHYVYRKETHTLTGTCYTRR